MKNNIHVAENITTFMLFFFLEHAGELRIISLIEEEKYKKTQYKDILHDHLWKRETTTTQGG
jgi:hypothetical protein